MLDSISATALTVFLVAFGTSVAVSVLSHFFVHPQAADSATMPLWAKIVYGILFLMMGASLATILPDLVLNMFVGAQAAINNQTNPAVRYIIENQTSLVMYIRYFFWGIMALGSLIVAIDFQKRKTRL